MNKRGMVDANASIIGALPQNSDFE
jgi:hypothetical protein